MKFGAQGTSSAAAGENRARKRKTSNMTSGHSAARVRARPREVIPRESHGILRVDRTEPGHDDQLARLREG